MNFSPISLCQSAFSFAFVPQSLETAPLARFVLIRAAALTGIYAAIHRIAACLILPASVMPAPPL